MEQISRRLAETLTERMRDEPIVIVQGPRTVGKSTLLADLASTHGVGVIDLDDPPILHAVAEDPGIFVRGDPPVCIDEFQKAPIILDSIKAELNRDTQPGRFVLTGSTRFDALPRAAQSLTGRLHVIELLPFSQGELDGVRETFLTEVMAEPSSIARGRQSQTTREEYVARICRGGLPLAVDRNQAERDRWFDDYLKVSLERDLQELSSVRHERLVPALLQRLAGQTAQVLNMAAVARDVGLTSGSAETYTRLLGDLFLIRRLEAWGRTLRSRAAAAPKLHMVDSGLAARLLRLTPEKLARLDPAAMTEFGHLLETFVVGELLKQATWSDDVSAVGHWRTHDGQEVDLVVEHRGGEVTAFEVKAAERVTKRDGRGLRALRDALGDSFSAGCLLTTGQLAYKMDTDIYVVPIDQLWRA